MNVDLLFDHYFNFWSTKTDMYKNEFNLINVDSLQALNIGSQNRILLQYMGEHYIWCSTRLYSRTPLV